MKRGDKSMFLGMSKKFILELTTELNAELEKISVDPPSDEREQILDNCDGIALKIKDRLNQLKSILEK